LGTERKPRYGLTKKGKGKERKKSGINSRAKGVRGVVAKGYFLKGGGGTRKSVINLTRGENERMKRCWRGGNS